MDSFSFGCTELTFLLYCVSFISCSIFLFTMLLSICMVDKRFYICITTFASMVVLFSSSLLLRLCCPLLQYSISIHVVWVCIYDFFAIVVCSRFNIFILHRLCLSCWVDVSCGSSSFDHATPCPQYVRIKWRKTYVIEATPHKIIEAFAR